MDQQEYTRKGKELADKLAARTVQARNAGGTDGYCARLEETEEISRVRHALLEFADEAHAQWPQYKGRFDTYILARAIKRMECKHSTLCAEKGDYILVHPKATVSNHSEGYAWVATVFSPRMIGEAHMEIGDFEIL